MQRKSREIEQRTHGVGTEEVVGAVVDVEVLSRKGKAVNFPCEKSINLRGGCGGGGGSRRCCRPVEWKSASISAWKFPETIKATYVDELVVAAVVVVVDGVLRMENRLNLSVTSAFPYHCDLTS
jgi:hypothetical protein